MLASHDGYLVGLFPTGDGFMFRLDEEAGEFVRISQTGYCGFVLPQTDGLYIGTDYGIVQYASGEPGRRAGGRKSSRCPNRPASAPLKSAVPGRSSCPFRATACRNPLPSTPRRAAHGPPSGWMEGAALDVHADRAVHRLCHQRAYRGNAAGASRCLASCGRACRPRPALRTRPRGQS